MSHYPLATCKDDFEAAWWFGYWVGTHPEYKELSEWLPRAAQIAIGYKFYEENKGKAQ